MNEAIDKVANFLSKQLNDFEGPEGIVVRLSVHHIVDGKLSKDGELCHVRPPYLEEDFPGVDDEDGETIEHEIALNMDESDISGLARQFYLAADEDAQGLGGLQSYRVLVMRKHSAGATGRWNFRIVAGEDSYDESGLTEAIDTKGLLGQCMRHTEQFMRNSTQVSMQMLSIQQRTISKQAAQIDSLVAKSFQSFELMEELISRKHERDMEVREQENSMQITETITDTVKVLAPIAVNKIVGKKILPEENSSSEEILQSTFATITPAQMERMERIFTPTQMQGFGEIMDTVIDRDEKRTEKKQKQIEGKRNGSNSN
jgi:hypothetical protein